MNWAAVENATAYLVHYGNANESDPKQATKMGYTEDTSWSLAAADVPELSVGDKIYLYVQAYEEAGIGESGLEKAQYLHDGEFTGSAWSKSIILTK